MSEIVRRRVVVSGIVQGVFFRARVHRMAASLGLTGWVRNLPDGRVEAVFEGPARAVDEAVAWCGRGPEHAIVTGMVAIDEPVEGLAAFEVRS